MQPHTIEHYKNLSGGSRVFAYELGEGSITLELIDLPPGVAKTK